MIPKIKKNKKVEEVIIDAGLIYSRAMVLMQNKSEQSPELTMESILSYELFGVPFSLFKVDGSMRIPKNKSQLKNKLKVEVNCRVNSLKVQIIDGSAVLWTISWTGKGAVVTDFLSNVRDYLQGLLRNSDVYLIFDRYFDWKEYKEANTFWSIAWCNQTLHTPCGNWTSSTESSSHGNRQQKATNSAYCWRFRWNSVVVSVGKHVSCDWYRSECCSISYFPRQCIELRTFQEEADVIIIHQLLYAVEESVTYNSYMWRYRCFRALITFLQAEILKSFWRKLQRKGS